MKLDKKYFLGAGPVFLFTACLIFSSCQSAAHKTESPQIHSEAPLDTPIAHTAPNPPRFSSENIEVKTFEVIDISGKRAGWGYDIYSGNNKVIHQPIIPAIPGNKPFKTESDAMKIGLFAVRKMKAGASLPTLLIKELDSLGVIK